MEKSFAWIWGIWLINDSLKVHWWVEWSSWAYIVRSLWELILCPFWEDLIHNNSSVDPIFIILFVFLDEIDCREKKISELQKKYSILLKENKKLTESQNQTSNMEKKLTDKVKTLKKSLHTCTQDLETKNGLVCEEQFSIWSYRFPQNLKSNHSDTYS